jgi:hypothetical protein
MEAVTLHFRQPETLKKGELWTSELLWKRQVEDKLEGIASGTQWLNFKRCGREFLFRHCYQCRAVERQPYHCNLKWCPVCNWRITKQRREFLSRAAFELKQPKHVVLTMRNFPTLDRRKVREFTVALARLRRAKVFRDVQGGTYSIEITNEGRGWHLHAHLLVEARWVDAGALAIKWGKLLGQEFGIVKVKDARGVDYLVEVTKYVCKGSDLATWSGHEIFDFVAALRGVRCFGVFGRLFHMRKLLSPDRDQPRVGPDCGECGGGNFYWLDERTEVCRDLRI